MKALLIIGLVIVLVIAYCTRHDSDLVPYTLKGIDVYVMDNETNVKSFVKRLEGNYFSKEKLLKECRDDAYITALNQKIDSWSYVCCTVTYNSDCETEIQ